MREMASKKEPLKQERGKKQGPTSRPRKTQPVEKTRAKKSSEPVKMVDSKAHHGHLSKASLNSPPENLHVQVALRAYSLYQRRGGYHGLDLADWFEAERQVLQKK